MVVRSTFGDLVVLFAIEHEPGDELAERSGEDGCSHDEEEGGDLEGEWLWSGSRGVHAVA